MILAKSILLFVVAAVFEIGGAWLVWQTMREHRRWLWAGLGVIALGAYGFVATLQPDAHFGRILAAYGVCSWPGRSRGEWRSTVSAPTAGMSPGWSSASSGSP
jgi:hypothetical protein